MKKPLIITSVVAVVIIAILLSVPFFTDVNKYKGAVLTLVKEKSGKDVNVAGDISFRVFPDIALTLNKISVTSQFKEEGNLVTADKFILRIKLLPLLQKNIEISSFKLVNPVFNLHVKEDGSKNWENAEVAADDATPGENVTADKGEYTENIEDAQISEEPVHSPAEKSDSDKPVKTAAKEKMQDDDEPFEGEIPPPSGIEHSNTEEHHFGDVAEGGEEPQPNYDNQNGEEGQLRHARQKDLQFKDIKIVNAIVQFVDDKNKRNLRASKINIDTAYRPGNNQFDLSGKLEIFEDISRGNFSAKGLYFVRGGQYGVDDITIKLDDIEAHSTVVADLEMYKPTIKIALYMSKVDLNKYKLIGIGGTNSEEFEAPAADKADFAWSDQPIDFSFINKIDMHVNFKVTSLTYKDITTGDIMINSYIRDNKLTAAIKDSKIFDGVVNADLVVDKSTGGNKAIKSNLTIEHLDISKLPKSMAKVNMVSGLADVQLKVNSIGLSQKSIVGHLNGTGNFKIAKCDIDGVDMLSMLNNATSIFKNAHISTKTSFDDISGLVDIKDGVVHNNNVALRSDALNMDVMGLLDLNNLTINYRLNPQYSQDAEKAEKEPQTPILITGKLLDPNFSLDVKSVVQDLITKQTGAETIVKKLKTNIDELKKNIATDPGKNDVIKDLKSIFH
jgi:uncharacterized protein involved in outer membrane biogenesis